MKKRVGLLTKSHQDHDKPLSKSTTKSGRAMHSNSASYSQPNGKANPNLPLNLERHFDNHAEMEREILEERLQQAHDSFTLAQVMTGAFGVVSLFGAILLLFGKVPAGTLTTVGGLASTIGCHQLAKDANDRLDKTLVELHKENVAQHSSPQ